jgi:hypothetical protein
MLRAMPARVLRTLALTGMVMLAMASPAWATVSIVAVDPATGQVGVAAASCAQFDLARIATVLPGVGAAVSQGRQRGGDPMALLSTMQSASTAQDALDRAAPAGAGGDDTRQYAVVMRTGGTAMRTGSHLPPAAAETSADTVVVVGNSLTSPKVVERAKAAFLAGSGDLAHRLIAGLLASSAAGGDRRCGSQTATSAFIIVAGPGQRPVVPIRGLPGVALRRQKVFGMVGKTVAADELGDLLRDASGLRRPSGPGSPDLYLSLIQPAHAFNAVELLAQGYRQLLATPSPMPSPTASSTSPTSVAAASTGSGSSGYGALYAGLAVVGVLVVAGIARRSRTRRRRTAAGATTKR